MHSPYPPSTVDAVLRNAAERHQARVVSVTRVGSGEILSFTVSLPDLETDLVAAHPGLAALLPCRVVARPDGEGSVLEAVSPCELASLLERDDLETLTVRAERRLRDIMTEASQPMAMTARASAGYTLSGIGAREDQMNLRATIPPRIDNRGSKIEDMAGTGKQDTQGG